MNPITFFVAGEPKGQPRPRAFARNFGGKWQARVYDAGTAEGWKGAIALAAKPFVPFIPLEGPVRLDVTFYFPRPKAHFTKKGLRPTAPAFHVSKPDRDNCEKALLDALKQLGMMRDDSQVCAGAVVKRYGAKPGAEVIITPIGETVTHPTIPEPETMLL